MNRTLWILLGMVGLVVSSLLAQGEKKKPPPKMPEIVGAWTGDWGPYDPAKGTTIDKAKCKQLDCQVALKDQVLKDGSGSGKIWEATFEGECGRPYKYTIKMEGRQASETVMFKGTVDLGESDGGVYDWIGRANDKEFAGFYTSSHHVGVFRLTRAK
jgi:hypothetical protein